MIIIRGHWSRFFIGWPIGAVKSVVRTPIKETERGRDGSKAGSIARRPKPLPPASAPKVLNLIIQPEFRSKLPRERTDLRVINHIHYRYSNCYLLLKNHPGRNRHPLSCIHDFNRFIINQVCFFIHTCWQVFLIDCNCKQPLVKLVLCKPNKNWKECVPSHPRVFIDFSADLSTQHMRGKFKWTGSRNTDQPINGPQQNIHSLDHIFIIYIKCMKFINTLADEDIKWV